MNFAEKAASLFNKEVKHPEFKAGDTVSVHVKVKEGDKERIQIFKGNVIKVQGAGSGRTFTVRKMSGQFGVERTWPLSCPSIDRVDLVATGKVRRSKIFYLRGLKGRAARIQSDMVVAEKSSNKKKAKASAEKSAE
jgi:large subunit ribosomal protein L19